MGVAKIDRNLAINVGKQQFIRDMERMVNLDNVVDTKVFLSKMYDDVVSERVTKSLGLKKNPFQARGLEFKNSDREYQFFSTYVRDSDAFFSSKIGHLRSQITSAHVRKIVGSSPEDYYTNLNDTLRKVTKVNEKDFASTIKNHERQFEEALGKTDPIDTITGHVLAITSDVVQGNLVIGAGLRQLTHDGSLHSAMVEYAMHPKKGILLPMFKHTAQLVKLSASHGIETKKILEVMEKDLIISHISRIGAVQSLALDGIQDAGGTAYPKLARAREWTKWGAGFVSKWSGADALQKATRIKGYLVASEDLKHLDSKTREGAEFLKRYGWKKEDWDLIKPHLKGYTHLKRQVGINIDSSLDNLPEGVVKRLALPIEKADDTKARLARQIKDTLRDTVDDYAAISNQKTGFSLHMGGDAGSRFFLAQIYRFKGIALSQYISYFNAIKRINGVHNWDNGVLGTGLSQDVLEGLRNPVAMFKILASMVAGGYATIAINDLARGRTPPAMDLGVLGDAISQNRSRRHVKCHACLKYL